MYFNNDYQISLNKPRHLFKISAKRMGAYWKESLNRGGHLSSSQTVGDQVYLLVPLYGLQTELSINWQ